MAERVLERSVTDADGDTQSASEDFLVCHNDSASDIISCAPCFVVLVAYAVLRLNRTSSFVFCRADGYVVWYLSGCAHLVFFEELAPHELLERWKATLVATELFCLLAGESDFV
jgi:hypothetical protein